MYLTASVPLLFFLASYFVIPESPRWLSQQLRSGRLKGSERLSKSDPAENLGPAPITSPYLGETRAFECGRHPLREETCTQSDVLRSNAFRAQEAAGQRERGINPQLDEEGMEPLKKIEAHEELTYSAMLKDSSMTSQLMIVCGIWMTGGFVYYGITLSAGSISKEVHLNMFLMGLVELPAYLIGPYLADKIGRKHTFMIFNVMAAFFCLVSWAYPRKQGRLLFALCGKIFASASFALVWMWAPEIFPTRARSLTTAIGSQAARVGSILAPYVVVLMSEMETGEIGEDGKPESPMPQPVLCLVCHCGNRIRALLARDQRLGCNGLAVEPL